MRNGPMRGTCINSICYNFKTAALKVDTDATWRGHCANLPSNMVSFCDGNVGVPVSAGNLFVVRNAPNPFRSHLNISFALPTAGHVTVEVYSADGRRVADSRRRGHAGGRSHGRVERRKRHAGGVYLYKVVAGANSSSASWCAWTDPPRTAVPCARPASHTLRRACRGMK